MTNWKNKFDKQFIPNFEEMGIPGEYQLMHLTADAKEVKDYIQTEIIEKLIEDIPDKAAAIGKHRNVDTSLIKKHLKAKWLPPRG